MGENKIDLSLSFCVSNFDIVAILGNLAVIEINSSRYTHVCVWLPLLNAHFKHVFHKVTLLIDWRRIDFVIENVKLF